MNTNTQRIVSVDLLRGLTMFLMILANIGFAGAPFWMKHYYPYTASGITYVDLIFPVFLFVVGISIPLAFNRYGNNANEQAMLLRHIFARTFALLAMGYFYVNTPNAELMGMTAAFWCVFYQIGFIFVWHTVIKPEPWALLTSRIVRSLGIIMLLFYFFYYRNAAGHGILDVFHGVDINEFLQWWGILGIIGWAYLVGSIVYLLLRRQPDLLLFAAAMLIFWYIAGRHGLLNDVPVLAGRHTIIGSHPAITVMGTAVGAFLLNRPSGRSVFNWMTRYAIIAVLLAIFSNVLYGMNKNDSTPSWCFISAAVAVALLMCFYGIADVKKLNFFPINSLVDLGGVALTAYVFHDLFKAILRTCNLWDGFYSIGANTPIAGFFATLLAVIVISAAAILLKKKLKITLKI